MQVNIRQVLETRGASMTVTRTGSLPIELPTGESVTVNVQVEAEITNTGELLLVQGKVNTPLELSCDRCLTPFAYNLSADFLESYVPVGKATDEQEFRSYHGETLDLAPAVLEAVQLALPMRILCGQECKGLCPRCGANLNEGPCKCKPLAVDPRLSELGRLLAANRRGGGKNGESQE